MLAGLQGHHHLVGMDLQRGVDMHDVDFRIPQHLGIIRVTDVDSKIIPGLVQLFPRALADGVHVGMRIALINRNEFFSEFETDDGDVQFLRHAGILRLFLRKLGREISKILEISEMN